MPANAWYEIAGDRLPSWVKKHPRDVTIEQGARLRLVPMRRVKSGGKLTIDRDPARPELSCEIAERSSVRKVPGDTYFIPNVRFVFEQGGYAIGQLTFDTFDGRVWFRIYNSQ